MTDDVGEIIIRLGNQIDRTISLDTPVLSIGRIPDATITLQNPVISRQHAELRVESTGVVLTDVGSSNGTFIDGERLSPNQPQLLSNGMSFQIGPYILTYRASGADDDEEPALVGEPEESAVEQSPPEPVISIPLVYPQTPPRPTFQSPEPPGPGSTYLTNLPDIYQENNFLSRFLLIFETLWEPLEHRQDHIDMYFDPHTAPRSFLPWLASWLDLPLDPHWPESRSRDLLAEAMDIYRWRGTKYGLSRLIEVSTGSNVEISEDPDRPFIFDIRVSVTTDTDVSDNLIQDLIQAHKPAHTGYVLEVVRP